jgi:hypothetical protein
VASVNVNAHVTSLPALSTPPPLHADLVVYVVHAAFAMQLVPFDTHFFVEIAVLHKPFEVPSLISSHAFNLQDFVPVETPTGKANIQTPSVPEKQPAST